MSFINLARSFVLFAIFLYAIIPVSGHDIKVPKSQWSFEKPFGTFDRAELQRGFQVYTQVCSTCHSLSHIRYDELQHLGYTEAQVKSIAAQHEVPGPLNDEGNLTKRPATPGDRFALAFPNELAARAANNGAYPPDQSMIVKARKNGPDYVKALLLGYITPPSDVKVPNGMYYNAYFPGHQIAMAPPLSKDLVKYSDGTSSSVEQMAHDVTAFLTWASEPTLEDRKQLGVKVMSFLIIFTAMMYVVMRRTWRQVKGKEVMTEIGKDIK